MEALHGILPIANIVACVPSDTSFAHSQDEDITCIGEITFSFLFSLLFGCVKSLI